MAKVYVSWNQVEDFVRDIEYKQKNGEYNFTGVYGLPRGGLVLAVMISHKLNIPMLMSPCPGCIIVDDICDTGESLLHYVKNSSGDKVQDYTIATMYYKENILGIVPDIYSYVKDNEWIVFPWELGG